MKRLAILLIALLASHQAMAWGAVQGRYGGAAYRGPAGGAAVRTPSGATAVRAPYGGTAYRGGYGYGYRPYAPVAGAAVAGVAVGAAAASIARPYYPPPYLCAAPVPIRRLTNQSMKLLRALRQRKRPAACRSSC